MHRALVPWLALLVLAPAEVVARRIQVAVGQCLLEAMPDDEATARRLATQAEELLQGLEADLGVRPRGPYRIFLIPPGDRRDSEMARLDALAPPWASGFLVARMRTGAIRLDRVHRYPYDDSLSVLLHEATHMLLYDAGGESLPRWFEEGVATWEGRRWGLRDVLVYSSAVLTGELPYLADLDDEFRRSASRARLAYAASFDFVSWSARQYGEDFIPRLLAEAGEQPFSRAWVKATGVPLGRSEAGWRRGSLFLYRWLPLVTGPGSLWLMITLLFLLAGARRRQRSKEIFEGWEREEQGRQTLADPDEPVPGEERVH